MSKISALLIKNQEKKKIKKGDPAFTDGTTQKIIKDLKASGVTEVNTHISPISPEHQLRDLGDWKSYIDEFRRRSAERESVDPIYDYAQVEIPDKKPILVAFSGDWHLEERGTNLDALKRDIQTILETPGMYLFGIGDETSNGILGGKMMSIAHDSVANPTESALAALAIYKALDEKDKFLGWVGGNHQEWAYSQAGISFYHYWRRELKAAYLLGIAFLDLKVGNQLYQGVITHKHRYNSSFNLTHTCKRLMEFNHLGADFAIVGDSHVAAVEEAVRHRKGREETVYYARTGTYKTDFDRYGAKKGFPHGELGPATFIFSPDEHKMRGYKNLQDAVEDFRRLRDSYEERN